MHPDVRNCSCDAAQANVQAALLASGDGNNEGAAKVAQHVSAWHTEGDHLDQRHGAIELTARRGSAEHRQSGLIIRLILEQSGLDNS